VGQFHIFFQLSYAGVKKRLEDIFCTAPRLGNSLIDLLRWSGLKPGRSVHNVTVCWFQGDTSMASGKILVAQGGGPTAVINQSLVGVALGGTALCRH
jgi:hypothetical protein